MAAAQSTQAIAHVVTVKGEAYARAADGSMRQLKAGDPIYVGETLVTAKDAQLVVAFKDGHQLTVLPNESFALAPETAPDYRPDAGQAAISTAEINAVIQAIEQGGDLNQLLEETAAGLGGAGGENSGNNFVRLLRIAEDVRPAEYRFEPAVRAPIEGPEGGSAVANRDPAVQDDNATGVAGDALTTQEDVALTIGAATLLANDSDPDGDPLTIVGYTQTSHGSLAQNPDGSLTYTPVANYNGPDSFTYTVSDGQGGTATATVNITVTPVNDSPVAVDDAISTSEDAPVAIAVRGNDSDPEGDALTVTGYTQPGHGSVALDPVTGNPVYTPEANWNGTDSFTYTVSDGNGGFDTATVTVTVNPVNDIPVALDDVVFTPEDTPLTIPVRVNDSDSDGDALTVTAVTPPAHGTVTIDPSSGNPVYTPAANYNGPDSFTYTISDGHGGTDTAAVTVNVGGQNDNPIAADDSATTAEDTPVTVAVRGNDTDPDGDPLTVLSVTQGAHGTVAIDPVTGNPVYTPNADYNGTDSFTYTVTDGVGTDTATVTVTVTPGNDAPVALDDSASTNEDVPVTIAVRGNDSDVDGDPITVTAVTQGSNGAVAIDAVTGNPVYTPNTNFNGTDSFTYTVSDGHGGTDTATVTVTVSPVNDAPNAVADEVTTAEEAAIAIAVRGNDSDPENDSLTVTAVSQGSNGSVVIDAATGNPVYTPNANFNGTDTFTYTIDDGHGGTDTATVTVHVTPVNDAPNANDDAVSTNEDTAVAVAVRNNDSDPENDTLTVTAVTQGGHGTVAIDPVSGNPVYTPNANWNGTDSFTYTISDGNGGFDTATVTVTVRPVNDGPAAVNDSYSTPEDTQLVIAANGVLGNDSDLDGDSLTVTAYTQPANGTVTVGTGGNLVYTPNSNFNGTETLTYTVSDGNGGTATATVNITVTPVNDAPVAVDDAVGAVEDVPATYTVADIVTPNDTDLDGDTLAISAVGNAVNGTVVLNANGTVTFTPTPNFNGVANFDYTITDGNGGFDTATVTVNVAPADDASVLQPDVKASPEDVPATGNVLSNDSDIDNALSVASFTVLGLPGTYAAGETVVLAGKGSLVLDGNGDYTFTPEANWNGAVPQVTYTTNTGSSSTLDITITPLDDTPSISDDVATTPEDTPVTINVLANDSDADGDTLTITHIAGQPAAAGVPVAVANGTATLNADGTITFNPAPNYNGPACFTYTATDGTTPVSADVNVTVTPVNNAPVAVDDSVTTAEDTPVTILVRGNDSDIDGDSLTVTGFTQPTNGTVVLDGSGNPVYTPNLDYMGPDSFSYTISDGKGGTASATVNITVTAVNDPPRFGTATATATVSEEGLLYASPDTSGSPSDTTNATVASGSFNISDVDSVPTVTLSVPSAVLASGGQPITWTGDGTGTLVGSAGGNAVITISITNSGAYTVTLKGPVDHATAGVEDLKSFAVTVTASDGAASTTGTLTVNVEDDMPATSAKTDTINVAQQDTNLMIVLDVSGSMTSGTVDRLAAAKTAITNLINTYDGFGDVAVKIVTFSTTASDRSSAWLTAADALALLTSITASGWTNYDAALAEAINAWDAAGRILTAPSGGSLQNLVYFMSDGQPNENDGDTSALVNSDAGSNAGADAGIQAAEETIWENFLTAGGIKSYALGIGDGLTSTDQGYLDPIAYNGATSTEMGAIMVPNVANLASELQKTVAPVTSGNLLTGATPGMVGADGGHVASISVGPAGDVRTFAWDGITAGVTASGTGASTATFDGATHVLTVTTEQGGLLVIDLDNGEYAYTPPVSVVSLTEVIGFTLIDRDGDTSPAGSLTLNVARDTGSAVLTGTSGGDVSIAGSAGDDILSGLAGNDTLNGNDGNDWLAGGAGADTLNGGAGNDKLDGGTGNDTLNGGDGADLLIGGQGDDRLTGGAGADIFQWSLGDKGSTGSVAVDRITDFDMAQGDVLDLRDLLNAPANATAADLDNFLHFQFSGGNTTVYISATGAFNDGNSTSSLPFNVSANDVQQIVFEGVNLVGGNGTDQAVIQSLLNSSKLIVD